jgi:Raf kinase inhibitor-like YbhB/YbcL family protein
LTSTVVNDGQMIPKGYRCQNPSPPLSWTAGPSGTLSYAIVFKDVTKPQQIVMHWVIYDIPSKEMGLPEHMPSGATLTSPASPVDAKQGPNYSGMRVYAGPCAPSGTNMYKFTLYALDVATLPDVPANANATQIETALEGSHKLATAVLNITSMP